ncbi:hypothetical protein R8Z50_00630 [Longispora sp. K20-0274]|uniref:hypothetical protein n=1 Tax=Longispora sp. K20-0274 TaxID=3088255 RepID=UPI0039999E0A
MTSSPKPPTSTPEDRAEESRGEDEVPPPADPSPETAETEDADDKWEAFAPDAPKVRRGRIRRFLGHEWTLAAVGSVLLAVLMTWPTVKDITRTIPEDIYDPLLQAWQIAWAGHALVTDPLNLWNANPFYPESGSLAFTDAIPGYAPLGMIGSGFTAAVVRYNVVFVLLHALAFFGAYVLLRQLGARRPGAAVAGMAFAYAPWKLAHGGHMNVISVGGIALALAMLARGHGFSLREGYRPDRTRIGWVIAGWVVAAWQMTLGFAIGIPFGYVLLTIGIAAVVGWLVRKRPVVPWRIVFANLGGGALFTTVTLSIAFVYMHVKDTHPNAERTEADLALFSPPPHGLLTAPSENWLWGAAHAQARSTLPYLAEQPLLPGFFLIGLAIAGLFFSTWKLSTRLWLGGATLVMTWLALGTQSWGNGEYGYLIVYRHLLGMDALRTPGRLMLWVTLLLAVLAAGAVSAFAQQAYEVAHHRPLNQLGLPLRLAMVLPVLLVGIEGWNTTPHPVVPTPPVAFSTLKAPLMILPSDQFTDEAAMLWSTDGFPTMVNGGSAFYPARQDEIRNMSMSFPSPESVQYLRDLGVKTVVVLRDRIPGTAWERAATTPSDGLGIDRREDGNTVIFTL